MVYNQGFEILRVRAYTRFYQLIVLLYSGPGVPVCFPYTLFKGHSLDSLNSFFNFIYALKIAETIDLLRCLFFCYNIYVIISTII